MSDIRFLFLPLQLRIKTNSVMKLLIIDDNEAVLRSLKLVFTGVFDRVVTVSNPQLLPALLSAGDVLSLIHISEPTRP
mgnify:CR=1 FL=1